MRAGGRALIYTLFLLSGCTGLIYEVVWSRELIFVLGGTTYAITTVLVAFMSGLGLGSYTAGRISDRLRQPGRFYGYLEIVIGLYALVVPLLLRTAEPLYRSLYPLVADMPWLLTGARFLVSSVVLLLPTTCMGATLPILVRYITREGQAFGRSVSLLYGINTFGAMLGTMAAGFWLIPAFGLMRATIAAASVNLLIGITAIIVFRSPIERDAGHPARLKRKTQRTLQSQKKRRENRIAYPLLAVTGHLRLAVLVAFGLSGFAAMAYQIAWTRALVMSVGSSTYAFTCILAAFIFGLAIGSLAIARWVDRWRRPVLIVGVLELAIALSAVLMVPIYGRVPILIKGLVSQYRETYGTMMAYQFGLIIAITVVPTFLMGAIFPLVTRIIATKDGATGAAVGRAYAANTLGAVLGSFLAGFVMIRSNVLGVQNTIVTAALLNVLIGAWLVLHSKPPGASVIRRAAGVFPVVLMIPIIAATTGQWNRELLTSGPYLGHGDLQEERQVIYYGEGVDLTVSVTRRDGRQHSLSLQVNGKGDASVERQDMLTQLLLGHLPALLTNDGKRACVIGLGSGITLSAVARHPSYEKIDCVEISTEVIQAAEFFNAYNYNVLNQDSRVRIIRGDGRNHLSLTDQMYDLIVSEPSNPWIAGVANLFTRQFFRLCENRLNDGGRLCVWLHGYSMSIDDFRMVIHTLSDVFPFVSLWQSVLGDYFLIAGRNPFAIPLDDMLRRFNHPAVRADLCRVGLSHLGQVIGTFITSGTPLRDWVTSSTINTDDNAALEFSAPRNLYNTNEVAIPRLLFERRRSPFDEVLAATSENQVHKLIQDRAAKAIQARWNYRTSLMHYRKGSIVPYIEYLWKAYQQNHSDDAIQIQIGDLRRLIKNNQIRVDPAMLSDPDMLTKLYDLPPLPMAPRTGGDLEDLGRGIQSLAVYCLGIQKLAWAEHFLKEAQDVDLDNAVILESLTAVLAQGGRMAKVIQKLDQLLKQQPDNGRLNYLRAGCAVQEGDFEAALVWLEAALKLKDVTPAQMKDDFPMLKPIWGDPRLNGLLVRYTQPPTGR